MRVDGEGLAGGRGDGVAVTRAELSINAASLAEARRLSYEAFGRFFGGEQWRVEREEATADTYRLGDSQVVEWHVRFEAALK